MNDSTDGDLPELVIADQDAAALDLLRDIQRAALLHSEAAQAIGAALVKEGRLFAQTVDGRRWREKLLRSTLVERATLVWQNATLWMTEETDGTTPSALIDAVAAVAASPRRDVLLDRLFRGLDDGPDDGPVE